VHECRAQLARLRGDSEAAGRELDTARRLYVEMGATTQVERLASEIDGCGREAWLAEPETESLFAAENAAEKTAKGCQFSRLSRSIARWILKIVVASPIGSSAFRL